MISWFLGVWPLIEHAGLGGVLIIGCLAAAWFSPVFKKDFIYAAVVIAAGLFVYGVGVHDEKVKRDTQEAAMSQAVHDAVEAAKNDKTKDRFDDPRL